MRLTIVLTALLLLPVVLASSPVETREESARYVGATFYALNQPDPFPDCESTANVAGACFAFDSTEGNATISVQDDVASEVCFKATITNETGSTTTGSCDPARISLKGMPGATGLRIHVEPALGSLPPTQGTIRVTFEKDPSP